MNGEVTPIKVLLLDEADIRGVGISNAKATYIRGIAKANIDGNIELLTTIKGIGKWTSEMFLIFSLCRLDVFSLGDAGLQRAVKWLYEIDGDISEKQLVTISDKWRPYRSLASLYLWEIINKGYINKSRKLIFDHGSCYI